MGLDINGDTFCKCTKCGEEVKIPNRRDPEIIVSIEKYYDMFQWHVILNDSNRRFTLQTHETRQPKNAKQLSDLIIKERNPRGVVKLFKETYDNIDHYPISLSYGSLLRGALSGSSNNSKVADLVIRSDVSDAKFALAS